MSEYWKSYDYEEALKRAREKLPQIVADDDTRFEIPKVNSEIEGNRTFINGFKALANAINRKEQHLLKFFSNELGTSANIEGNRAILQGKHPRALIQKAFERYIQLYVLCATCGKPDTKLELHDRIMMMRCEACGAQAAVKALK